MPKKKTVWKTYETDQLSISLPESFIAGHPARDRKALQAEVDALPAEIHSIFKNFFVQRNFVFMAADRGFKNEMTSLTCLVVLPEPIPLLKRKSGVEEYVRLVKKNLGSDFETVSEDYIDLAGYPAARLLSEQRARKTRKNPEPEITRKHLMLAFRLPKKYWAFDFISDAAVFDAFLPVFDESIASLQFKDKAK
ncbi:MAG TPA: hypothetical protein DCK95_02980 [Anaerolineaceae bacterium]|nr:hypothetical protein [Anaerolineaceae bacterium]